MDELSDLKPDQIRDYVNSIRNSANNAYNLLEGLLDWARLQRGIVSFNPEPIALASIVDQSIVIALEHASLKNIEITCDLDSEIIVFADPNMLKFIVRNLLSNAIKFTPDKGSIVIAARIMDDNSVEVSVRDNGIGMSSSIAANLFQIDKQVSRSGTNSEPGSGLGLVLCKEFVDKLNGKIWVESEENKGTTFFISIPLHENTDKTV
jgi:signal transduction histidine kinase